MDRVGEVSWALSHTAMTRSPSWTAALTWAVLLGLMTSPCRRATVSARGWTRAAGLVPADAAGTCPRRRHSAAASCDVAICGACVALAGEIIDNRQPAA
jgi:hypothetical protein